MLVSLFMKNEDTAIVRDRIPAGGLVRVPVVSRALHLAAQALARMWHESAYAHECLLDPRVPASVAGSLRWVRRPGGSRLAGRYLPAGGPTRAAGPRSGEIARPGSPRA
jgi:hypothetical protein